MSRQRLPLGIDIGTMSIRVAEFVLPGPQLHNVVTTPSHPTAQESHIIESLQELLGKLHTKERRCVLVFDNRDAVVREAKLPPMSRTEMHKAAKLEAARFVMSEDPHTVNLTQVATASFALSSVSTTAIERALRIARAAKLRVVAIDHASYALSRAYPHCDAVIDIGLKQTRFYALKATVPFTQVLEIGGKDFTRAVSQSYAIDEESAEGRKRTNFIVPGHDTQVAAIVQFVGRAMRAARANGVADIERITLTGNGARLPRLAEHLERDTGCLVELASRLPECESAFPSDILRAAMPDWGLACGAGLWSLAEERAT